MTSAIDLELVPARTPDSVVVVDVGTTVNNNDIRNNDNHRSSDLNNNLLLTEHINNDDKDGNKTDWFVPRSPLYFVYFEKVWYLFQFRSIPIYVHISLPMYILFEILWAVLHIQQMHYWLLLTMIIVCGQLFCIFVQILATILIALQLFKNNDNDDDNDDDNDKHDHDHHDNHATNIHRIVIWPYGALGYCTNAKQLSHFLMIEFLPPFIHLLFWIFFAGITFALVDAITWNYEWPADKYLVHNILNGIWSMNLFLCCLPMIIPVYGMKITRLLVVLLHKKGKRRLKTIVSMILSPSLFMTLILLIWCIFDQFRPILIFLFVWCVYQSVLLIYAVRHRLLEKLPLFQGLEWDEKRRRSRLAKQQRHERRRSERENNTNVEHNHNHNHDHDYNMENSNQNNNTASVIQSNIDIVEEEEDGQAKDEQETTYNRNGDDDNDDNGDVDANDNGVDIIDNNREDDGNASVSADNNLNAGDADADADADT